MVTKRARRWIARGLSIGVVLVVVLVLVVTWLQAGTLADRHLLVSDDPSEGAATVVAVQPDSVILERSARTDRAGVWGLEFDGGRAVIGSVLSTTGSQVERELLEVAGALVPGTRVAFDRTVWDVSAMSRLGFTEDLVAGPTGTLSVWTIPGPDDTWVVLLHGRDAGPDEAIRAALAASAEGFPVAIVSYRTDPPQSAGDRHGYGYDEWRDAAAAVNVVLAGGGSDLVLVGFGSGASVAGVFLEESPLAERVVGVVLDAPIISLGGVVEADWRDDGVPGWLVGWLKAVASVRFGVDFGAIDHLTRPWEPPTLVLHGRADDRHPIGASRDLALERPEEVVLIAFPNAGTGESWNVDSDRYEAALTGFLARVAGGRSSFEPVDS